MNDLTCVICSTHFFAQTWDWLIPKLGKDRVHWYFYDFGRLTHLKRLRASFLAACSAKLRRADLLISNDPREAFLCAFFAFLLGIKAKQIACAFNFPILPQGRKWHLYTWAFSKISQFIVYSQVEKQIYSEYFKIPPERIEVILWSVALLEPDPEEPLETGNYICAIGSNARDYQTLMSAMEKNPDILLLLVVRPNNLEGLKVASNVKLFINISPHQALNILKYSRFMVLPLNGSQAPCGHVTIVWAMQLSKAFIITSSQGISDYVIPGYNAVTYEAFAVDRLAQEIRTLWNAPEKCQELGENGRQFAEKYCSPTSASQQLEAAIFGKNLVK